MYALAIFSKQKMEAVGKNIKMFYLIIDVIYIH